LKKTAFFECKKGEVVDFGEERKEAAYTWFTTGYYST
jgi:hypothetical protein